MLFDWPAKLAALDAQKARLDAHRPLPPALIKNLEAWFKVELTYSSNAIEGNTLTRNETAVVIEKGLTIGGKTITEHLEAQNHARALDFIASISRIKPRDIDLNTVLRIHEIVLDRIEPHQAGRLRSIAVRISGSTAILPSPRAVPGLMAAFVEWLRNAELHPVSLAAEAHLRLVQIHPFADGNGRTARLLMNLLLMQGGFPPAIIAIEDRLRYINSIEQSQQFAPGDDFLRLMGECVQSSLAVYLTAIEPTD